MFKPAHTLALFSALAAAPACGAGPTSTPDESVSVAQQDLLGAVNYAADCTPGYRSFLDDTMFFGRVTTASPAFAACMSAAVTGPGAMVPLYGGTIGPYRQCIGDPFYRRPLSEQLSAIMAQTHSENAVTMNCTGGSGNASAALGSYDHSDPEVFSWSGWLNAVASLPLCGTPGAVAGSCRAPGPWPMSQAAGIVWHEAMHTRGYTHGANDQAAAIGACGYAGDPTWNFQVNTMPYIVGNCLSNVLDQSASVCGADLHAGCGPGELRIVDNLNSTTCSCVRDPVAWAPKSQTASFDLNRCANLQMLDIDGDGDVDPICLYDYGAGLTRTWVQTMTNRLPGPWVSKSDWQSSFDVRGCRSVTLFDVNRDGRKDLLCTFDQGFSSTTTFAQPQLPDGTFGPWTAVGPSQSGIFDLNRCTSIQSADFNGDHVPDLVCTYDYGGAKARTFVQVGQAGSVSAWWANSPVEPTGTFDLRRCQKINVADIDRDGQNDLVCVYNYGASTTRTFIQRGSATGLSAWTAVSDKFFGTFGPERCAGIFAADVDGDGFQDLVCPYNYGGSLMKTFIQKFNPTTQQFGGWLSASPSDPAFDLGRCRHMVVTKADSDSIPDLLCVYDYGGQTRTLIQHGVGDGSFGGWDPWSQWDVGFDVNRCRLLANTPPSGTPLPNGTPSDYVCAYDDVGSTRTFVQLAR